MTAQTQTNPLDDYRNIPSAVRHALTRFSDDLDTLQGKSGMTLRETIHHLTEANVVSAAMIVAALGSDVATFDWSWLWPNREWIDRMRFADLPPEPAIETLAGLIEHTANLVAVREDALDRKVMVHDTPEGEEYPLTVREILSNEADHVREHLGEIENQLS